MSPTRAFAATALALLTATPALGQTPTPAADQPQAETARPSAEAPPPPRRRATPEERAAALRADPLAQAAFWSREIEVNPADADAGLNMARALRTLGRFAEAGQAADQVLVIAPGNVDAMLESARAKIASGQGFYAVEPLTRARAVAPRDWRAANLLGVAYQQTQRSAEAQAAWAQALSLSAENPEVLNNQAMAAAADGDLVQAEALLRRAAARPDAGVLVRQNLALVVGLRGNPVEAEALNRQNLPPEQVAQNVAWLRGPAALAPQGRNWESLRNAETARPAGAN